jgi:hypothetical protein
MFWLLITTGNWRRKALTKLLYRMPFQTTNNFVPGNAYLVVVGDVNAKK